LAEGAAVPVAVAQFVVNGTTVGALVLKPEPVFILAPVTVVQLVVSSGEVQVSNFMALMVAVVAGLNVKSYVVLADNAELPRVVLRAVI
jgi:hypothetical protein